MKKRIKLRTNKIKIHLPVLYNYIALFVAIILPLLLLLLLLIYCTITVNSMVGYTSVVSALIASDLVSVSIGALPGSADI